MPHRSFSESEVAYTQHRLQDAAAANRLGAQALPRSPHRSRVIRRLNLGVRRAGAGVQRLWPVLPSMPDGKDVPAVQS
jgi:hypothetical protein